MCYLADFTITLLIHLPVISVYSKMYFIVNPITFYIFFGPDYEKHVNLFIFVRYVHKVFIKEENFYNLYILF